MNSLRTRFAALFVLVAVVGSVSIGIWSYAAAADRLSTETDRSLTNTAATARALSDHDRDNDAALSEKQKTTARELADSERVVTQQIDPDGKVVTPVNGVTIPVDAADRAVAAGEAKQAKRDLTIDGLPFRILTVSTADGHGAVQVIVSTAVTGRVLDKLGELITAATLAFIALAAVAGWLIGYWLTVRLSRLASAADTVAATGRLDVEVPPDGRDEAGRLAAAFAAMLASLAGAREAQQRLVQDAGHELRTPLTSLRTNIGVLRRHDDLDAEVRRRVLDDLEAESRELTALVNEVVALASDRSTDEEPVRVALAPIVARAAERLRRRYPCDVHVSADDSVVVARLSSVERAVANLLDNGAKFGGADGPVEVVVRRGTVEVLDRGPGVRDVDAKHVFDRFYRATDARSMPGSGLGLAIVRDMAESSGGEVFVEARAGGGARIGFRLPLAAGADVVDED